MYDPTSSITEVYINWLLFTVGRVTNQVTLRTIIIYIEKRLKVNITIVGFGLISNFVETQYKEPVSIIRIFGIDISDLYAGKAVSKIEIDFDERSISFYYHNPEPIGSIEEMKLQRLEKITQFNVQVLDYSNNEVIR